MTGRGRPTDYLPEFCEQVIEWGRSGKSLTWMAASIGVAKSSIYDWEKVHPEFAYALTQARQLAQAHWEDLGQDNLLMAPGQGSFNGSVWSRSMAARFPDDWREKSETALTGPGGTPLQIESIKRVIVDPSGTGT